MNPFFMIIIIGWTIAASSFMFQTLSRLHDIEKEIIVIKTTLVLNEEKRSQYGQTNQQDQKRPEQGSERY